MNILITLMGIVGVTLLVYYFGILMRGDKQ